MIYQSHSSASCKPRRALKLYAMAMLGNPAGCKQDMSIKLCYLGKLVMASLHVQISVGYLKLGWVWTSFSPKLIQRFSTWLSSCTENCRKPVAQEQAGLTSRMPWNIYGNDLWHLTSCEVWVPTANPQKRKARTKDAKGTRTVDAPSAPLQSTPAATYPALVQHQTTMVATIITIWRQMQQVRLFQFLVVLSGILTLFHYSDYRSWSRFWRLQNPCLESLKCLNNNTAAGWLGDQTMCLEAVGAFQWHVGASPLPALESKNQILQVRAHALHLQWTCDIHDKTNMNDWPFWQLVLLISVTLPVTNMAPEKNAVGWWHMMTFFLGWDLFMGYVSFRDDINTIENIHTVTLLQVLTLSLHEHFITFLFLNVLAERHACIPFCRCIISNTSRKKQQNMSHMKRNEILRTVVCKVESLRQVLHYLGHSSSQLSPNFLSATCQGILNMETWFPGLTKGLAAPVHIEKMPAAISMQIVRSNSIALAVLVLAWKPNVPHIFGLRDGIQDDLDNGRCFLCWWLIVERCNIDIIIQ